MVLSEVLDAQRFTILAFSWPKDLITDGNTVCSQLRLRLEHRLPKDSIWSDFGIMSEDRVLNSVML